SGGTIAQRYQHPFVLAVAMKIDKYELSRASTEKARKLVKPVYEKILAEGWDDWPENAHSEQKALEAQQPKPRYMKPEDILAMMREALKAPSGTESARLERLKAAREGHETLLAEHYKAGNIRKISSERHSCCRCNQPGTLSAEVSGNGHWYCADHYTG
ncbi:MAG: hypothetical protein ACXW11_12375, partial [Methylotenera sp.]